jgi:hypothetical protein
MTGLLDLRQLDDPRRRVALPPGGCGPGAPVRGEYPVVLAARWLQITGRYHGHAGGADQLQPVPGALTRQRLAAARGIPGHVTGDVDSVGAHLTRQPYHLGYRITVADHQVAAALAEFLAQRGQ